MGLGYVFFGVAVGLVFATGGAAVGLLTFWQATIVYTAVSVSGALVMVLRNI